jgi:prevent-host-death family protein
MHYVGDAEANRQFSRILRDVRAGDSFVVTARGRPIARIVPVGEADPARVAARDALLRHLASQPARESGRWLRDELYDDVP